MSTRARTALTLVSSGREGGAGVPLSALGQEAARAGVDFIQIREKNLSSLALEALVRDVVAMVKGTLTRVIVNGRPDIALVSGADGVQLGEDALPIGPVRKAFPTLLVSASRHSLEGAKRAAEEGAHMLLVGPVFPTPGKPEALGLDAFRSIAQATSVPVHAIGGIDPGRARSVVEAGACGIAAIRAFLEGSPAEAVRAFRAALT